MQKIGQFYSWEVVNPTTAIKTCDKSFYMHRGSGIPHGMAWFFGADHMSPGKKTIRLIYYGKEYSANLIFTDRSDSIQIQILWHADLGSELFKFKSSIANDYSGIARFIRKSEDLFELEMTNVVGNLHSTEMPDSLPIHLKSIIAELSKLESEYLQAYTDALNIEDNDEMLAQQQRMTIGVRLIKKWSTTVIQMQAEMEASGLFASRQTSNPQQVSSAHDISEVHEIKIGQYIQEHMRTLEKVKVSFSEAEINSMLSLEWSRHTLHIGYPFFKKCDPKRQSREQISDATGNNRYWSKPFQFDNFYYFVCSQWFYSNREPFDAWYSLISSHLNLDRPRRTVVVDDVEEKRHDHRSSVVSERIVENEALVNSEEKIGLYVQKRLGELEAMGISFEPDYLDQMTTVEWARKAFSIGFPFVKIMDAGIPIKDQIVDNSRKNRYWRRIFAFGNVKVFVCNEWHEYRREMFDTWLKQVPQHILTTAEGIADESDPSPDVVRLQITDYKMRHR